MNDVELLRSFRADVPDRAAAERVARLALDALRAEIDAPVREPARRRLRGRRFALTPAGTFAVLGIGAVVLDGSGSGLAPAPGTALAVSRQVEWIDCGSPTAPQALRR